VAGAECSSGAVVLDTIHYRMCVTAHSAAKIQHRAYRYLSGPTQGVLAQARSWRTPACHIVLGLVGWCRTVQRFLHLAVCDVRSSSTGSDDQLHGYCSWGQGVLSVPVYFWK
jgi:hypothetical protein